MNIEKKKINYFKTFPQGLFTPENNQRNITNYFKYKYSGIQTYAKLSPAICSNPEYVQKLVDIGLIPNTYNAEIEIHHRLSRILFQPKQSIVNEAKQFLRNNKLEHCVGIQYRTGGKTSSFYERAVFLTLDKVVESAKLIRNAFVNKNRTVFLTTDSSKVMNLMPKLMKPLPVKMVKKYKIGHSNSQRKSLAGISDTMNKIIMDICIFSSCDTLFWTQRSSFGELGYWLSYSENVNIISIWIVLLQIRVKIFAFRNKNTDLTIFGKISRDFWQTMSGKE